MNKHCKILNHVELIKFCNASGYFTVNHGKEIYDFDSITLRSITWYYLT